MNGSTQHTEGMQSVSRLDDVKIFVESLSKLYIGIDSRKPSCMEVQDTVTETDIDYWIQLDEKYLIGDAFVQDNIGFSVLCRR